MIKWPEDVTMKFVSEYVKHQCLWDSSCEQYKIKQARLLAYAKIEEAMGIEGFGQKEIAQKIKNIRSTYSQELRKVKDSREAAGACAATQYKPSLKWFRVLDNALQAAALQGKPQTIDENLDLACYEILTTEEQVYSVAKDKATCSAGQPNGILISNRPSKRLKVELQGVSTQINRVGSPGNASQEESEFEVFGRLVGLQLKGMPLALAFQAQQQIQTCLNQLRLQNLLQPTPNTAQAITAQHYIPILIKPQVHVSDPSATNTESHILPSEDRDPIKVP